MVAEVEVRGFGGAVYAQGEAGLRVECAGVEGRDDEGLGPWAAEGVCAESYDICGWLVGVKKFCTENEDALLGL